MPDDDEVVRVVRHARGERAALEPGPGDETETDAAGREMAFDDRDLREIPIGVGDGEPALGCRLLHDGLGDIQIACYKNIRSTSFSSPYIFITISAKYRNFSNLLVWITDKSKCWHIKSTFYNFRKLCKVVFSRSFPIRPRPYSFAC